MPRLRSGLASRLVPLLCAACLFLVALPAAAETRVVVGSKAFTEGRLVAELMAQLLEAEPGVVVERRFGLGGTQIVFTALERGQIDLYPEYTGTVWSVVLKNEELVRDPLEAYTVAVRELERRHGVSCLAPLGFSNSYALAMAEASAERLGVASLSDLARVKEPIRVGMSHEFLERPDGFPGLAEAYGLDFGDVKGMEHGLAYEALASGKVDVVDTYTTDGKLLRYKVRVLEDDRRYFPPYDAVPLVRSDVLARAPVVGDALAKLAFRLDDARMRALNHRVEVEGGTFAEVARAFLAEEGLLEKSSAPPPTAPRAQGFAAYLWSRRAELGKLAAEHLLLTAVAVLLAIVVAVPLGVFLTRVRRMAAPVLGGAGIIQTIPSLALLAFMITVPGLGLGVRSAIAALFLYALLPIIRNTHSGISQVDADLVEAARAMGLRDRQVLWSVELPLAIPTIMAGVRTSAVIGVGMATLAAFVGAGGLGDPILTGLQLDDVRLILSGALPAALLAVVVDVILGRLERLLTPRGLS
jgi:osmoprotectant transport system permease protein